MQSSISPRKSLVQDQYSLLLDLVEARMLASIRVSRSKIPGKPESARKAAEYHLTAGGQRVRAKIALQAGLAAGLSNADAATIAATVELLHNASLVHDDIQDQDKLRRGQQAVWSRFGVNTAICAGDLLISAAYATLCKLEDSRMLPQMILLLHERVGMTIDGQCADLGASAPILADSALAVTEYQQIAMAKAGALLGLPLELVLLASGHQEYLPDAWHAAAAFAISYQIVDDLHDMKNDAGTITAQVTYNIVHVFNTTCSMTESIEKARRLGLEKIDLAILLAQRLPFNIGECLEEYAGQLRNGLCGYKVEASIGGND